MGPTAARPAALRFRRRAVHGCVPVPAGVRAARRSARPGVVRVGGADDARAGPGGIADRGAPEPARRGGPARRLVARAGLGCRDDRSAHARRRARRDRPRRALPAAAAAPRAGGRPRARHRERPVHPGRADREVARRHAGTALRTRRLPARALAGGASRGARTGGADRTRPVLPAAHRARLPMRGRRAARQRLQRPLGGVGRGASPDRVRTLHNGVSPRRPPGTGRRAGGADPHLRRPDRPPQGSRDTRPCRRPGPRAGAGGPAAPVRQRAGRQRGLRRGDPKAGRRPRPRRGRHLRGTGLAGDPGIRGGPGRRHVQHVRGSAADGHRGRDVGPADRRHRRRRYGRGGRRRWAGRAARRPGGVRGGVRRPVDPPRTPEGAGRRRAAVRARALHAGPVPRRRPGPLRGVRGARRSSPRPSSAHRRSATGSGRTCRASPAAGHDPPPRRTPRAGVRGARARHRLGRRTARGGGRARERRGQRPCRPRHLLRPRRARAGRGGDGTRRSRPAGVRADPGPGRAGRPRRPPRDVLVPPAWRPLRRARPRHADRCCRRWTRSSPRSCSAASC